jgi:hypothetical protein
LVVGKKVGGRKNVGVPVISKAGLVGRSKIEKVKTQGNFHSSNHF